MRLWYRNRLSCEVDFPFQATRVVQHVAARDLTSSCIAPAQLKIINENKIKMNYTTKAPLTHADGPDRVFVV